VSVAAETIAALATPPGRGGVGIVRVSGPAAPAVAERLLHRCPQPRRAEYLPFFDDSGDCIDHGIALYFPAPHSFTGEAVLEFQGHGGPVVLDQLLVAIFACGVRPARAGEFSERAFLNGKLDLAQAEAVADLIDAASTTAARAALRSLDGLFSRRVHAVVAALTELRIQVEGAIDFAEEEIELLDVGKVDERLAALRRDLASLQAEATQGCLLREGMRVVLAGRPNAGKSSLLNQLAGRDTAIVTDIAGTTRDLLREEIDLDGMPLHIVDTAGLREARDAVEAEGVRRAWNAIEKADRILLLVDHREGITDEAKTIMDRLPEKLPCTVIHNKVDLSNTEPTIFESEIGINISLSAKTGDGVDLLRKHLQEAMGYRSAGEGHFMARRRHLEALARADCHLTRAADHTTQSELLAEELRLAQNALGEITGEVTSDDLLGRIFSTFCIGK